MHYWHYAKHDSDIVIQNPAINPVELEVVEHDCKHHFVLEYGNI